MKLINKIKKFIYNQLVDEGENYNFMGKMMTYERYKAQIDFAKEFEKDTITILIESLIPKNVIRIKKLERILK